jgi:hypothetical protein
VNALFPFPADYKLLYRYTTALAVLRYRGLTEWLAMVDIDELLQLGPPRRHFYNDFFALTAEVGDAVGVVRVNHRFRCFSVEFELTNQRVLFEELKDRTFPITSKFYLKVSTSTLLPMHWSVPGVVGALSE